MIEQVKIVPLNNTRTPFSFKLKQGKIPVDLAGKTVKVFGKQDDGTAWIAETTLGVTAHPTRSFTVDTTNDYLIDNDNLVENGDQIIVANSGGGLPTGLAAATRYFVHDREPNRFKVSLSPDGPAVDITGAGTGTQSYYIVGSGQYDWQATDVDAKGTFWLWVNVHDGSEYDTFPVVRKDNNRGLRIDIVSPA